MKRRIFAVLGMMLTLAVMAMPAGAAVRLEFPEPGVQFVPASPGGSANMVLRLINEGATAVSPVQIRGYFSEWGNTGPLAFTSLDATRCPMTNTPDEPGGSTRRLTITVPNLAAGETLECVIHVERPASVLRDGAMVWLQPSQSSPLYVVIGERVEIFASAELLNISSSGGLPVARVRVTTTNRGNLPLVGVAFDTCGQEVVTPAPTNGCPTNAPPEPEPLLCPVGYHPGRFASPPLPANGSASCEILISPRGGAFTTLPTRLGAERSARLFTPNGRELLDATQFFAPVILFVNLGLATPVPAMSTVAIALLALLLITLAVRSGAMRRHTRG